MTKIYFTHPYYKLYRDNFTTMRGKSLFDKYKEDDVLDVILSGEWLYSVRVEKVELVKIGDMSLTFMEMDGEYHEHPINSMADFINLINSFYPRKVYDHLKANKGTEMTVIYMRRNK